MTQGQGFAYLTYTLNPTTELSLITGMTLRLRCASNRKVVAIVALISLIGEYLYISRLRRREGDSKPRYRRRWYGLNSAQVWLTIRPE